MPNEFFGDGVSDDVRTAVDAALAQYEKLGAVRVPVSLPRTELSIPVYYIIAPAEASSNLSRFDGVKFGHRAAQYKDLADMYRKTRAEGFGDEVKRRIMIGTYVLSHGYYDAYYLQAQKIRRMLSDDFQQAFKHCDVIAGPVAPTRGLAHRRKKRRPAGQLPGRHLHAAGLAGRPARHERAGRIRRRRHADRPAADRQLPAGEPAAEHGAPVPAGHRFPHPQAPGILSMSATDRTAPPTRRNAKSLLVRGYEVVIGFETHAQLSTRSKIFSRASTAFGAEPNTQACAVDLALPGTLPVMNKGAVERAIRLGLAVDAHIAARSVFARKNYFYPDLPKGYQISQFEIPVVQGGEVGFMLDGEPRSVRLVRAHLEEDAGKSLHEDFIGQSGIDLNRAGTPLLEIVTEPDMRSSAEAVAYARELHRLVTWIGICDGNMQEGSFRCDANVSVRKPGAPLGTRREIKNLNSFKFMQQAIDYEVRWQIEQIEDGHAIEQATVLFDPATGETRAMRTKEDAADYRYFPDPDLPPLVIAQELDRRGARRHAGVAARAARASGVSEHGLSEYDASILTQSKAMAQYFLDAVAAGGQPKLVCNWITGELSRRLNATGSGRRRVRGRRGHAGHAGQAHRRRHDLQQRGQPGVRCLVERRRPGRRCPHRSQGPAPDERQQRTRGHHRRGRGRQRQERRRIPPGQGQGLQRAGRPDHEGQPRQGQSGPGQRAAAQEAGLMQRLGDADRTRAASDAARRLRTPALLESGRRALGAAK